MQIMQSCNKLYQLLWYNQNIVKGLYVIIEIKFGKNYLFNDNSYITFTEKVKLNIVDALCIISIHISNSTVNFVSSIRIFQFPGICDC